ncbi:hypothetical protein ABS735_29845 [Streptomyces sp. MMCC 100]|uniref:hypothetical protein n=1 Tax=Streptomyces sp. MMCC 100 TaxID=3163555 RepID=UPI0035969E4E
MKPHTRAFTFADFPEADSRGRHHSLTWRATHLVGRPPLTYPTWWRRTTAARLLRTCETSVNTIAQRVGYTSPYAFTTLSNASTARSRALTDAPHRLKRMITLSRTHA